MNLNVRRVEEAVAGLETDAVALLTLADELASLDRGKKESDGRRQLSRKVNENYRFWHSIAWPLVTANLPERVGEFEKMYDQATFAAQRFVTEYGEIQGNQVSNFSEYFSNQIGFVRSIPRNLQSKVLALRGLVARDLMEDELTVSLSLLRENYIREAGVIAGVVLERHLKMLCEKYDIEVGARDMLGQLNDKLRSHYPNDAEYRRVQFFSEIRASCAHDKGGEPERSAVSQLISGVQGFIAAIG
jgi:hypothetical protein